MKTIFGCLLALSFKDLYFATTMSVHRHAYKIQIHLCLHVLQLNLLGNVLGFYVLFHTNAFDLTKNMLLMLDWCSNYQCIAHPLPR